MLRQKITPASLKTHNSKLNQQSALERILWLYEHFDPDAITLTTSGGKTSAITPHLVRHALENLDVPKPTIVFIDTGYYNSETLNSVKSLEERGYQIRRYQPLLSPAAIEEKYPNWPQPSSNHFEKVKEIIKREPLARAIQELKTKVWMSGLTRAKTLERKNLEIIEYDQERKIYRFHPLADWDNEQITAYMQAHSLSVNNHHFDIAKGPNQDLECGLHLTRQTSTAPETLESESSPQSLK